MQLKKAVNETFETEFGNEELGIIAGGLDDEDKKNFKLVIEDTTIHREEPKEEVIEEEIKEEIKKEIKEEIKEIKKRRKERK